MRLIDADALDMYECLRSYYGDAWRDAQRAIDDAPTVDAVPLEDYKSMERTVNKLTKAFADAVEIVRCKDCKWWNRKKETCIEIGGLWRESDFCSWGERREDGE